MKRKLLKYALLIVSGFGMLYPVLPIGDFCSGMAHALWFMLLGILFVLFFAVMLIVQTVQWFQSKKKFEFTAFFIGLGFIIMALLMIKSDNPKFWTGIRLEAASEVRPSGSLVLYNNQSFAANQKYTDFSCTHQGTFYTAGDTLILERDDLAEKTGGLFTTKYIIDKKHDSLISFDRNFRGFRIVR